MECAKLIVFVLVLAMIGIAQSRPVDCTSVLDNCQTISSSELSGLKSSVRQHLAFIYNNSSFLSIAKSHPNYLNLTMYERGFNASFNPTVDRTDYYALGRAGRYFQYCIFPIVWNVSSSELVLQMAGRLDHYAGPMQDFIASVAALVPKLNRLVRVAPELSEGNSCIVTDVVCLTPEYPQQRLNGQQFSEEEVRLREIVNVGMSVINYSRDLDNSDYFLERK